MTHGRTLLACQRPRNYFFSSFLGFFDLVLPLGCLVTPGVTTESRKISPSHIAGVFVAYLVLSLPGLLHYPGIWVDEGWIAEVAHQCALGLPLGNPSHSELYRYADRVFWMPHLYFLALGGWLSLFGTTLESARTFSLLLGAGATLLLYALLTRGFGTRAAWWGIAAFLSDTFVWKVHRTVRFEPALTLCALLALAGSLAALDRERRGRSGTLAWLASGGALAALLNVHPNGLLLAVAVAAFLIVHDGPRLLSRPGPWLALACGALGVLPFLLYLLSDRSAAFANLLGQNSYHFGQHGLPGTPLGNELGRYAAYFPAPARLPAALLWLGVIGTALLRARSVARFRPPLAALAVLVTSFAFLPNKSLLYLTLAMPAVAAILSGLIANDDRTGRHERLPRVALCAAALLLVLNVAVDFALLRRNSGTHPRRALAAVAAQLRPGDRVAGTFVTWWAAVDHPFREFQRVRDLAELQAFRPTVVIVGDRHWEEARASRFHELAPAVENWLAGSGSTPTVITDPVLGALRVYRLADGAR